MGTNRREYEPRFKLETVLELLKGEKTQAQICRERGISEDLLSRWKVVFQERAPGIFVDPKLGVSEETSRIAELERLIGQQALELSVLKGASRLAGSRSNGGGR